MRRKTADRTRAIWRLCEKLAAFTWAEADLVPALQKLLTSKLLENSDAALVQSSCRVSTIVLNAVLREAC